MALLPGAAELIGKEFTPFLLDTLTMFVCLCNKLNDDDTPHGLKMKNMLPMPFHELVQTLELKGVLDSSMINELEEGEEEVQNVYSGILQLSSVMETWTQGKCKSLFCTTK